MSRSSDPMREDGGLRPDASATLTPTTALLENELVQETKGHRHVVGGHIDTVNGAVGTVVRMWVLTERSKRTEAWQCGLYRLRHMMQGAEARLSAGRAIDGRMS